jgi:phage gp29-like protein
MKKLSDVISDFELEDMEDSLSSLINKVIELLNKEEVKSNEEVKNTLEAMYDKLSEATLILESFELELNGDGEGWG